MSNRNGSFGDPNRFEESGGGERPRRNKRQNGREGSPVPDGRGYTPPNGSANGHKNGATNGAANGPANDNANGSSNGAASGIGGSSNRRNLSEISHLFLSDLRQTNGQGRTPPARKPPSARNDASARRDETVDLTNEEFDGVSRRGDDDENDMSIPPVAAVIGARLNGSLVRRACQYACGLARELPVGLIIVEETEVRLMWVMQGEDAAENDDPPEALRDPQRLRDALLEMSCDIAQWLVVLPNTRLAHARRLLAGLHDWVLLSPADHEGVVAGYRVLKGLCDLALPDSQAEAPRVTLALVDAADAADAQRHARKLMGVCKQFLDLEIAATDSAEALATPPAPGPVSDVRAFTAREVVCAAWPDAQAAAPAWRVLEEILAGTGNERERHSSTDFAYGDLSLEMSMFHDNRTPLGPSDNDRPQIPDSMIPPLARPTNGSSRSSDAWVGADGDLERLERRLERREPAVETPAANGPVSRRRVDDIEIPELAKPVVRPAAQQPAEPRLERVVQTAAAGVSPTRIGSDTASAPALTLHRQNDAAARASARAEQIDPPAPLQLAPRGNDEDEVIDLPPGETVADVVLARLDIAMTPVSPPMLPAAKLCVSRDGGIVLVAAASPGLMDLPTIGRAMTWATENRALLRMALSQYRLDDSADVLLHLLVSRADANAEALRPLLSTGRVAVRAYRHLSWGGRCGLLLEAA